MELLETFKTINTFVFDVDGVLTDGTVTVFPDGLLIRNMNIKDGYALQLAVKMGYHVVIISGGKSHEVAERLRKLGVVNIFMEVHNKAEMLSEYLITHELNWRDVLYMGDDIPDFEVMTKVGLACCPNDAVSEIQQISRYISPLNGGRGCGRDVIETVLKLRGDWGIDVSIPST